MGRCTTTGEGDWYEYYLYLLRSLFPLFVCLCVVLLGGRPFAIWWEMGMYINQYNSVVFNKNLFVT